MPACMYPCSHMLRLGRPLLEVSLKTSGIFQPCIFCTLSISAPWQYLKIMTLLYLPSTEDEVTSSLNGHPSISISLLKFVNAVPLSYEITRNNWLDCKALCNVADAG